MATDSIQSISLDRIRALLDLAEKTAEQNPYRSKQYVSLARKIGSRNKVSIPMEWKKRFCRRCNSVRMVEKNAKSRAEGVLEAFPCSSCGHVQRFPLQPKTRKEVVKRSQNGFGQVKPANPEFGQH